MVAPIKKSIKPLSFFCERKFWESFGSSAKVSTEKISSERRSESISQHHMSNLHSSSGSLSFEFPEDDKQHENCATQRRATVDTSNMNGSNSSFLDDGERRQDKKFQSPPLVISGGDADLPAADMSTSALAAMALGMDVANSPLVGSSLDGTYATTMQPQGGEGTSTNSAGPSLVYSHNSATNLLLGTGTFSPGVGNLHQQSTAGTTNMSADPQEQDDGTAAFTAQDEQLELLVLGGEGGGAIVLLLGVGRHIGRPGGTLLMKISHSRRESTGTKQ